MKILLVDDHQLVTDALKLLFLDTDPTIDLHSANNATDAVKLAQLHGDADIMLLDLAIPGVKGTSLLEAILDVAPRLKVLVLSGVPVLSEMLNVLQAGASGFAPKSMNSELLIEAVRFVLSGGFHIPADLVAEAENYGNWIPDIELPPTAPTPASNKYEITLTERQEDVLRLLAKGAPIKVICKTLNLSEGTIKTHVTAIYRAFGATNRTEALNAARRHGYAVD